MNNKILDLIHEMKGRPLTTKESKEVRASKEYAEYRELYDIIAHNDLDVALSKIQKLGYTKEDEDRYEDR
jgi:hypothetical protein